MSCISGHVEPLPFLQLLAPEGRVSHVCHSVAFSNPDLSVACLKLPARGLGCAMDIDHDDKGIVIAIVV